MTVANLANALSFEILSLPDPDREITGGYTGDLLSWVMGRAKSGDAWVTIMTNVNVVAVATLADVACVIIAENSEVGADIIKTASDKQINVLRSSLSSYEVCKALASNLEN